VACRSQDLSASASQEFSEWLKRSPEHIRAYLEIAHVYADMPAPEHRRAVADLIAQAKASQEPNVIPLNARGVVGGGAQELPIHADRAQRSSWIGLVAASILILVTAGTWLYAARGTYGTGIGEQRSITMQDGSIVELNARSKIRIRYDARLRFVELLEGQALFRVAKDHARPFIVRAGTTSVRAVGTQFDINRRNAGTTVSVVEGRVAVVSRTGESGSARPVAESTQSRQPTVSRHGDAGEFSGSTASSATDRGGEIFLSTGEQVMVTGTDARKTEHADIAAATAWTRHLLVFDGNALSEVLEEFSRHSKRRLIVDSPELANLKISGQYTSSSPDSFLRFLSLQEGVIVSEVNGEIHIRKE
jgi:transmembrane sensor